MTTPNAPPIAGLQLDLACGTQKRPGFFGVDMSADVGADLVFDLRKTPWPWADGSVVEVNCSHFFEHLTGAERIVFMEELYRVMAPGAKATIITPHARCDGAYQDPTHQWPPVVEQSYYYFNAAAREKMHVAHYGIRCDFDLEVGVRLQQAWAQRPPQERQFALAHHYNVAFELLAFLRRR